MIDDLAWFALLCWGGLVSWAFVAVYTLHPHRRGKWHRSATGVNLAGLMLGLALVFTLLVAGTVVHVSRSAWIIVVALVVGFLTHRLAMLLHAGRQS